MRALIGVGLVLSGLLACRNQTSGNEPARAGTSPATQASPSVETTGKPAPAAGLPVLEVLNLALDGPPTGSSDCKLTAASPPTVTLNESSDDILVIKIASTCSQNATLKIKYDDNNMKNKSKPECIGLPKGPKLKADFTVMASKTVYLICTVAYDPGNTAEEKFVVGWGREGIRVSEIALEDDP